MFISLHLCCMDSAKSHSDGYPIGVDIFVLPICLVGISLSSIINKTTAHRAQKKYAHQSTIRIGNDEANMAEFASRRPSIKDFIPLSLNQ